MSHVSASQSHEDWERLVARETAGLDPSGLSWRALEGIDINALYTRADVEKLGHIDSLPGLYPFVRGPKATMYAHRPWTIRQYAGFSTAEESNQFYRRNLAAGQKGLSVAFDLPTHRGYDSDNPRIAGDVGKAGVAIDSVEDMKVLFDGIPLAETSVSMTMNGAVLPILAMFVVAAEEQGVAPEQLSGTIQNDILKEFIVRNTYIYPPGPSMRIVGDVVAYLSRFLPRFNSISISGYHMQEAGATADLELAFTLADGLEYVRSALARGLAVDDFAPRLSFFFGVGMNLFMEIAKLRAARLLWAQLMKRNFEPKRPESMMLRMHCQTSGVSLTAQDPYNNIVRTTIEALAALLGGTQSLHTNAFDEALALPSDLSARIARNTQLILMHETDVTRSVDPLGGAYFIEALTDSLRQRALAIIDEVESVGGMTRALATGMPRMRIEEVAAARQARYERKRDVIIGVNRFAAVNDEPPVEARTVDATKVRRAQVERLLRLRATRDSARVTETLRELEAAAWGDANLLELCIAAARQRATLGEISDALERAWGRHSAPVAGLRGVYADHYADDSGFSGLRREIEAFAADQGRRPRILVAKLGQDGHDRAAKLIAAAFSDLGFDVDLGPLFQTPEEVAQQAVDCSVHVVGVSTHAGGHTTLVPELIARLRDLGADDVLIVCGGVIPAAEATALRAAGVSEIFGPGTPILEAARRVLSKIACTAQDRWAKRSTVVGHDGYRSEAENAPSMPESESRLVM